VTFFLEDLGQALGHGRRTTDEHQVVFRRLIEKLSDHIFGHEALKSSPVGIREVEAVSDIEQVLLD